MQYRKDINGLRAIAIIGIILFHLNINYFQGAIICIDIFFVLSGYLITSVILNKDNKFNLYLFWINRARRVLPLLLFIVFMSIPFALYFMVPVNLTNFFQSMFLTPLFLSNILFWIESGYWDLPSQMKPLLHTWSIAIEGQFYFLFPLIFLLKDKKKTLFIIILIWLLSLSVALLHKSEFLIIQTDKFLSLADHFMPFGRWWELMSGSFVAFLLGKKNFLKIKLGWFFSSLGLIFIFISIIFFNNNYLFPGPLSVIPVLGTSLVLIYSNENQLVYKFLNLKFLNHIGEISYSLYLWHFPILVFVKYFFIRNLDVYAILFILILTYLLSLFSYNLIEKPFYKKKILSNKNFLLSISFTILILCSSAYYLNANKLEYSRLANKNQNIIKEFPQYNFGQSEGIDIKIENDFSENIDKIKILIVGDSHGRDLARTLLSNKDNLKDHEFSFIRTQILEQYKNNSLIDINEKAKIDNANIVFLSRQFTSEKNQIKRIKKLGEFIKNLNKRFVIIGSAPEFYSSEGDLLLTYLIESEKNKNSLKNHEYSNINQYFYSKIKTYLFDTNDKLKKIAKDLDVYYLDRFEFTCRLEQNFCWGLDENGNRNFMDYSHFTTHGVKFFGKKIYELGWLKKVTNLDNF
tara:strand:+ start:966 stop:2864 length:1899 start_codon:yes stop_codon:yes gene_type:complete